MIAMRTVTKRNNVKNNIKLYFTQSSEEQYQE